jgi:hypothetical protein
MHRRTTIKVPTLFLYIFVYLSDITNWLGLCHIFRLPATNIILITTDLIGRFYMFPRAVRINGYTVPSNGKIQPHSYRLIRESFPMSLLLTFFSTKQSSQKAWLHATDTQNQSPINLKLLISKFWIAQTVSIFQQTRLVYYRHTAYICTDSQNKKILYCMEIY